ncbi:hypothetical protein GQ43DRAFT_437295 [Delitschia confertaspora ATCC 74209]|uniref:Initiator tRNA phosphoribosyl transferase n=1 Tax=Delitschia confertaspora ATCC 74209 TaxID=1513339 RepID=A0A9P4MVY0_9PLEO|nr:hypothetical protein GQ43DRAFT_437295 [Delitschia confertaspora ATCC 74209]
MPSTPLTTSDLIFPTQSLSLSSTLHSLKRSALSIHNRLSSITKDSEFTGSVADAYGLPLVANERCGSWYIPPERKGGSVYFKSTDGHMNEWSFSMRRLNLHILDVVGKGNGAVVVDSTRRGKSMPDALSKTVPIWCCVLNRAIFPDLGPHPLYTPPQAVSPSEHSQIEKRIDSFVQQFKDTYTSPLNDLRRKIRKPLRPLWVTPESSVPLSPPSFPDFHPVVLCTASRRVRGGEVSEGGYIQGAADDHEAWSNGLTPILFWENKDQLLNTNEENLPSLIAELVAKDTNTVSIATLIKPTTTLYVSANGNVDTKDFDVIITCGDETTKFPLNPSGKKNSLHLTCREGKLGSRDLRNELSKLPGFISSFPSSLGKILITCPTGKDLSLGVALAILCLSTTDDGTVRNGPTGAKISKSFIRQRLTWLTTSNPSFNPSRETLKSVNSFLMPDPSSNASSSIPPSLSIVLQQPPSSDSKEVQHHPSSSSSSSSAAAAAAAAAAASSPLPANLEPPKKLSLPAQIFTSLLTSSKPWKLTRTLKSALPTHPSGTVTGTAKFTPCAPGSAEYESAYLYEEEGEFVTESPVAGLKFQARRKYVYRLKSTNGKGGDGKDKYEDEISVFFHEDEKEGGIGGLFVEMGPLSFESTWSGTLSAKNKERHLCGEDLYAASWRFGPALFETKESRNREEVEGDKWWEVQYDVKGPKKDYVSWTRYEM